VLRDSDGKAAVAAPTPPDGTLHEAAGQEMGKEAGEEAGKKIPA
jgi:hypothetical protein